MEQQTGDDYLRKLASFIRANERSLAESGMPRRRRPQRISAQPESASAFNPLGWFGFDGVSQPSSSAPRPVVLTLDAHRLFYVLMRLEAIGLDVGSLDVQVDNPSRPTSYINVFSGADNSDTHSLSSFRSSLSAISSFSLAGGWWSRPQPPSVDSELKYVYSSFTKVPALTVTAPGKKVIAELANDPPDRNAVPMDAFKNLEKLECIDIDPRMLLGWDRLAESLRSLKIQKSGLEDISDVLIGAVVDDQARRQGSTSRKRRRRIPNRRANQEASFYSTRLPESVPESADESAVDDLNDNDNTPSSPPSLQLSPSKWASLKHLFLSDNALTFFPADSFPYLTSLTHLDLSSNLLVSIPPGLGTLFNVVSLNLSDNMIESVLGIYLNLGQVLYLNLSHNRLQSICGLERLHALERVDLRHNLIEESAEVSRLATLPNIFDVWIEGNPFVELEDDYRVKCFDYFWKERKTINLDGSAPGFYERRSLTAPPPEQMTSSRPVSTVHSPPVVAVGHSHPHQQPSLDNNYPTPPTSNNASPHLGAVNAVGVSGKPRRKVKRIVDLDVDHQESDGGGKHVRNHSESSEVKVRMRSKGKKTKMVAAPVEFSETEEKEPVRKWGQMETLIQDAVTPIHAEEKEGTGVIPTVSVKSDEKSLLRPARSRHSRYQTEFASSTNFFAGALPTTSREEEEMIRPLSGSATMRSKGGLRRARMSASVYEPARQTASDGEDDGRDGLRDDAEAYRRRIEALKKDMGEGWLKIFSQSQR